MPPLLDSRKLHAFTTLARVGGFTPAARELHLTRSAVSHAIRSLAEELGQRLLDRAGRRPVTLTEPGRRLLERARVILEEMKLARTTLAAEQG